MLIRIARPLWLRRSGLPREAGAAGGQRVWTTWSYLTRQVRKEAAEVISGVGPFCAAAGSA